MSIQPPLDTGVCRNNNISFTAIATGAPSPTVQWQQSTDGGGSWNNLSNGSAFGGVTTNTLTLINVGTNQNGEKYRAVFTNLCGSVTSTVTTLAVGAPINPGNVPPASATGCDGFGTVSFTADANGGNGTVYMSWQYSPDNGATWIDIPGTTTTSLIGNFSTTYTFTPTAGQNGYLFRAKFANGGCAASFSNAAALTVLPTPTVVLDPLPNQTVCNGANTNQENFNGSNATAYNWTNDNTTIGLPASGSAPIASPFIPSFVAINNGTTNVTATITVTPVNTSGATVCPGTAKTFTITVVPSPVCSFTGPNNICPGSTNTYTYSGGTPGVSYSWSVTGATISGSATNSTVSVVAPSTCGTYTVNLTVTKAGCSSTCSQTFNATDNTKPVFTGSYLTVSLGCNPGSSAITAALGSATATDNCSTPTITPNDGIVTGTCNKSQIRTFTATDACGNTATVSRTVTWTDDVTPPAFTGTYSLVTLGCNPTSTAISTALATATATDACGAPTITSSDGPVSTVGCTASQTRIFTATDGCGNTSTTSRTVSWTADLTPPTINANGTTLALGCNPVASDINAALGTASATDACGSTTITSIDGALQSSGCSRTQTRTFTARDGCNNTSTVSRTVTWTFDNTVTITANGTTLNAGCNPSAATLNAALGSATSTDACSTPTVTQTDGPMTSTGCDRSQTRSWSIVDGCGNTASTSRTVTWTVDIQAPVITVLLGPSDFYCQNLNPSQQDNNLGGATATDNCGSVTPTTVGSEPVTTVGCISSRTRTWIATDACGNTSTASRTITWSNDGTPPVFTGSYTTQNLGCNPTSSAITAALGSATASDGCGTPTLSQSDGAVITTGCNRSQIRTFTAMDACGNTSTVGRTVIWVDDVTAPVFTGTYINSTLGCNPTSSAISVALGTATATDACGSVTNISSSDATPTTAGCIVTQVRTFTAVDACNNSSTTSRSVSWTSDLTPPTFTGTYSPVTLGCNPTSSAYHCCTWFCNCN
jgi:hypothetical protein